MGGLLRHPGGLADRCPGPAVLVGGAYRFVQALLGVADGVGGVPYGGDALRVEVAAPFLEDGPVDVVGRDILDAATTSQLKGADLDVGRYTELLNLPHAP
ncbi:hypothetical protein [Nonomuraea sp. NPDC003709]|uniref:hypothetical protein n=1 Tax=Nonomuraea sp. NPDC003709 TaxID=3154450 RepID=UPI0033A722D4